MELQEEFFMREALESAESHDQRGVLGAVVVLNGEIIGREP